MVIFPMTLSGQRHMTFLILGRTIFGTSEAKQFKSGVQVGYSEY